MIIKNKYLCTGCGACKDSCFKKAIVMQEDKEGFLYPKIIEELCVNCGACSNACPLNLDMEETNIVPDAYVCQHKNDEIRLKSTSGGVFSAIAEQIIKEGGVVFGASYNQDWEVEHISVDNIKDLKKLYGSKYVQSKLNESFVQVKELLQKEKLVLFSGTPCQVEGLLSYLKKKYDKLYTIDFVCRGVPSPKVFKSYINEMRKQGELKEVYFRDKCFGYATSTMSIEFENGKKDSTSSKMKSYKKMFFKGLISRPSCYDCKYKTITRKSDFTIFDCWSMDVFKKEWDDNKGSSYIYLHSDKAKVLFPKIENINVLSVDLQKSIDLDGQLSVKSDVANLKRKELFEDFDSIGYNDIIKKYAPDSIKEKVINKVKPLFYKLKIIQNLKRKKSRKK